MLNIKYLIISTIICNVIVICNSARIFAYVPTPSISHQVVFRPLWKELSLRGHQVTLLTADPINDSSLTNLTEIDLHWSYEIMNKDIINIINENRGSFQQITGILDLFQKIMHKQMDHPLVQQFLIDPTLKFDVVIIENLMVPAVGFAKKFNCPLIGVTSLAALQFFNSVMGVPTHPVLYPDVMLPFDYAETFVERLTSVAFTVCLKTAGLFYLQTKQNAAIEKYFGNGFGSLPELVHSVSLFLINSNPILERPRSVIPTVQYIAGMHRISPKPLPQSLQNALDSAKDGFIYFSLGSNVKSKDVSIKVRETLLDTFSELPYKILWKFELDNLPNKSDNIIISKWFPQTDILRHPNIKLFITQGGLQSIEEAMCEGVPMIGMPYFADQPGNVQKMVRKGLGLYIDHTTIEKQNFKKAILEVIENPCYRDKVKEIAKVAQDQPIAPLDHAVWWIEYVIRHNGTRHLRSPLLDIPWYQYLFLDVIVCLTTLLVVIVYCCIFIMRVLRKLIQNFFKSQRKCKLT